MENITNLKQGRKLRRMVMAKRILSYDEFKQAVVDGINEELQNSFPKLSVSLRMVPKVNGFREALNIDDEDAEFKCTPNFYLKDYYEKYNSGTSVNGIVRIIVNTYLDVEGWRIFGDADYSGPENICRVVYTLINRNENAEMLEMVPHRDFLDLAVIYRVIVKQESRSLFSYILNNSVFKNWDMTEDELFERAKAQTDDILRPDDSVTDGFGILTNTLGVNGSGVMLSTDRLMAVADYVEDDIYLIPSSINEIFTMPVKHSCPEALKESLEKSLEIGLVEHYEWLSSSLYRFSRESGEVSIV